MHSVCVEKINCKHQSLHVDGETILQVCDFSDGAHDDLGAYLYGYYNQISEVGIL